MSVKLLTERHLKFLSLKGGCKGSVKSRLVKMPHCWKSHVTAHIISSGRTNQYIKGLTAMLSCLGPYMSNYKAPNKIFKKDGKWWQNGKAAPLYKTENVLF